MEGIAQQEQCEPDCEGPGGDEEPGVDPLRPGRGADLGVQDAA